MVRAKFKCVSLTRESMGVSSEIGTKIKLLPVYGTNDPADENSKFFRYTPSGVVELGTINDEAAKEFEIGKEYYLEFTKAN